MDHNFDVIIAGAGITGLATAYHLEKKTGAKVALAASPPEAGSMPGGEAAPPAASLAAAGLISGGWFDNFTRLEHAFGLEAAAEAWQFGNRAYTALTTFAETMGVPVARGERLRLATSAMELREVEAATAALAAAGFTAKLWRPGDEQTAAAWPGLLARTQAVQDDGPWGGYVNPAALLAAIKGQLAAPRLAGVNGWQKRGGRLELLLADGRQVTTEILVVATHLAIPELIPELHDAVVPVADQWHEVVLAAPPPAPWCEPGHVFSINHGYEWGVTCGADRLALGGARYLRKLAGIGVAAASLEPKVAPVLLANLAKTFDFAAGARIGSSAASRDCRPCDELPIIGPMYGEGRLLVATGYMGLGLTQGFFAGACLAELIADGYCEALPRRFWPERLRSLSS